MTPKGLGSCSSIFFTILSRFVKCCPVLYLKPKIMSSVPLWALTHGGTWSVPSAPLGCSLPFYMAGDRMQPPLWRVPPALIFYVCLQAISANMTWVAVILT